MSSPGVGAWPCGTQEPKGPTPGLSFASAAHLVPGARARAGPGELARPVPAAQTSREVSSLPRGASRNLAMCATLSCSRRVLHPAVPRPWTTMDVPCPGEHRDSVWGEGKGGGVRRGWQSWAVVPKQPGGSVPQMGLTEERGLGPLPGQAWSLPYSGPSFLSVSLPVLPGHALSLVFVSLSLPVPVSHLSLIPALLSLFVLLSIVLSSLLSLYILSPHLPEAEGLLVARGCQKCRLFGA